MPVIEAARTEVAIEPGKLSAEAGRLAYAAIERAVALALAGEIDAVVTAPISKEALHLAATPIRATPRSWPSSPAAKAAA